jgi:hypothetical protein
MLAQDRDRVRSTTEDPNGHVSDKPPRQRKILHIDMDAFFASVGQFQHQRRGGRIQTAGK